MPSCGVWLCRNWSRARLHRSWWPWPGTAVRRQRLRRVLASGDCAKRSWRRPALYGQLRHGAQELFGLLAQLAVEAHQAVFAEQLPGSQNGPRVLAGAPVDKHAALARVGAAGMAGEP